MKVLFNRGYNIGLIDEGRVSEYSCDYIENNIKSHKKLKDKDLWKSSGPGAMFLGDEREDDKPLEISLSGLVGNGAGKVLYVASVNDISAVYIKDLRDTEPNSEQHVLHGYARRITGVDYNRNLRKLVMTSSEDGLTYQIGMLNLATGEDGTLTEGDIVASNPSFDGDDAVLFNCSLVGRDANGNFAGYSQSMIYRLDLVTLEVEECVKDERYHLVAPKKDGSGNLYYLRRPAPRPKKKSNLFLDIILFPYRLIKALINFLNFFSVSFGGESLRSEGQNPTKTYQKSEKELFIEGNRIDAEKNLKENAKSGAKYPGVVPQSWQLVRRTPSGEESVAARGVVAFDAGGDGTVVYSNGRHLFQCKDGSESYLAECGLATVVRVMG